MKLTLLDIEKLRTTLDEVNRTRGAASDVETAFMHQVCDAADLALRLEAIQAQDRPEWCPGPSLEDALEQARREAEAARGRG